MSREPRDEFRAAIEAYRGIDLEPNEWGEKPRYVVPARWTAAHVCVRLTHALEIIGRCERKPGPKGTRTAWPEGIGGWQSLIDEEVQEAVIAEARLKHKRLRQRGPVKVDWRDYVASDVVREIEADAAEEAASRKDAPMATDIELAEEAAVWPARYLGAKPLASRALMLFAFCQAFHVNEAKAIRRESTENRHGVRILTRKAYDYHRKAGAELLASKLERARVAVRG